MSTSSTDKEHGSTACTVRDLIPLGFQKIPSHNVAFTQPERRSLSPGLSTPIGDPQQQASLQSNQLDNEIQVVDETQSQVQTRSLGGERNKTGRMPEGIGNQRQQEREKPKFQEECEDVEKRHPDVKLKDTNGWTDLSKTLHEADEREGKEVYENVDTILVFSGLFSAVIITLVIEAGRLLQRDQAEATTMILLQISQQLSSFSVTGVPLLLNSTSIPASLPPFIPDSSSIWVNALWFTALALSLITASLGMLVKQWFREYLTGVFVAPRERCRVRLFRRRGLLQYKVPEIAGFLPLLLQLALILFFAGLVIYIRILLPSIGWHIIALIAIWFLFFIITTIIPIFSPSCPYKTPFLKTVFSKLRQVIDHLYKRWKNVIWEPSYPFIWEKRLFIEEAEVARASEFDTDVLFDAYDSTRDINIWEMVIRCVDLNSPCDALATLNGLVEWKLGSPVKPQSALRGLFGETERQCLMRGMVACLRKCYEFACNNPEMQYLDRPVVDSLVVLDIVKPRLGWGDPLDQGLIEVVDILTRELVSIPRPYPFTTAMCMLLVPSITPPTHIENNLVYALISTADDILAAARNGGPVDKIPFQRLIDLCRVLFLCASRTTEETRGVLQGDFPRLTAHLADEFNSLGDCPEAQIPWDTCRCHCLLDMAMRLHKRVPGIVARSLFETLQSRSMKMFDPLVPEWGLAQYIQREAEEEVGATSQESNGPAGEFDWEMLLRGEEYREVGVRDRGEYSSGDEDKWEYRRLRIDCRYRIEFLLYFLPFLTDVPHPLRFDNDP
ncbi:hypothetical protein NLI96_g9215 [Meripilus lineatus]|uniref:DUF6535 domain-containing protein n=1 Tax=Meripilus lineatus TaxID=2056292 RepID=A0AAD5YFH5_9APHY|nr:hypothetical protein NLI96_g9215 [Physisporinus lineatus]